jgi:hypothetical protein
MKVYERSKHSKDMTRNGAKTTSAKTNKIAPFIPKTLRNDKQEILARAKAMTPLNYTQIQKSIKQGWKKTRAWLAVGATMAATFAKKNMHETLGNLEQFQKNLQKMQSALQRIVISSLAKTSDVIGQSTSKARYSIYQVTSKVKDIQDARQKQSIERQHKRKRAKMAFRWGLIFGVALALLYSPIAGSEMRRRISKGWQQSSAFFRRNVGAWA